jgi:hypothetical protein
MTITLLPGRGAELPWAGRPLRFGMTSGEARSVVEPHASLHATFVCGAAWAAGFALDGIRVSLFAGETDALAGVSVHRTPDHAVSRVAVGLDDIDLFGWPVDEVVEALRETGRAVRATRTIAWVGADLRLAWTRPRAPLAGGSLRGPLAPTFVDDVCLYATATAAATSGVSRA